MCRPKQSPQLAPLLEHGPPKSSLLAVVKHRNRDETLGPVREKLEKGPSFAGGWSAAFENGHVADEGLEELRVEAA